MPESNFLQQMNSLQTPQSSRDKSVRELGLSMEYNDTEARKIEEKRDLEESKPRWFSRLVNRFRGEPKGHEKKEQMKDTLDTVVINRIFSSIDRMPLTELAKISKDAKTHEFFDNVIQEYKGQFDPDQYSKLTDQSNPMYRTITEQIVTRLGEREDMLLTEKVLSGIDAARSVDELYAAVHAQTSATYSGVEVTKSIGWSLEEVLKEQGIFSKSDINSSVLGNATEKIQRAFETKLASLQGGRIVYNPDEPDMFGRSESN